MTFDGRDRARRVGIAAVAIVAVGCSSGPHPTSAPTSAPPTTTMARSPVDSNTSRPSANSRSATPATTPDPRWRFWVADKLLYTSPWYAGSSRIMVGFGCTPAPYYPRDPTCPGGEGRHHGIDMALACGTPLYAAVRGTVVNPGSGGRLGAAYGPWAFRIRTTGQRYDIVIGHVRTVFVRAGDVIEPHQRIALASDAGAPDGCHLHFEVRPAAASYPAATDPGSLLHLTPSREPAR